MADLDQGDTFAQTTAEFNLDSESDDGGGGSDVDLRLRASEVGGAEAYELTETNPDAAGRELDEWTPEDGSPTRHLHRRRPSASTVASFQLYTPDEERAVVRKLDRRLVLFVALLYMLSFLDRSNIGNARIAGMDEDLQTFPPRAEWYEWALTAFYISYISFEWMSLLWKLVPAHIFVSMIVLSWGITASLQAVAVSYPMLIALRAMLGIGEAGFTGIPFYLSFFFKRSELAFRTAVFISAAPLATSFASSLAWAIIKLARAGPIAPWRLLFLLEGFPSVLIAAVAWRVIPDSPQTAAYLTPREKKVATLRLRRENPGKSSNPTSGLVGRDVLAVLRDPIAWVTAAMFFLTNMAYSSLPVFLPTILLEMGHDALSAQALSAPPYLVSFILVLVLAHVSDRARDRSLLIALQAIQSALGYAVLALAEWLNISPVIRYLAVYLAAAGFFNVVTLTVVWNLNNQASESRQGGGFALMQLVGQCGPLVGTRLYPDVEGPFYTRGMKACAWAMFAVAVLAILLRFYMIRLNARAERADAAAEAVPLAEEEGLVGSGAKRRTRRQGFRYML